MGFGGGALRHGDEPPVQSTQNWEWKILHSKTRLKPKRRTDADDCKVTGAVDVPLNQVFLDNVAQECREVVLGSGASCHQALSWDKSWYSSQDGEKQLLFSRRKG